ncbi:ABC transporter substrate-binding protein [Pleomorphomonas oryzae]|uniref:ABC transporter substrate-binding protein n=1 Tax=Pleomorphomonas oryzae TaxID=261934 RepID=UPI0003FA0D1D|nr:ABC transporter substrate-binding protein [Pleomorphomonas oryzae]
MQSLSRRAFMMAAGIGLWSLPARAGGVAPRVVSLDYGLSSTLLSLGLTPVGIAGVDDWGKWVVEPPLPPEVADVGDALMVNLEALTALAPTLILSTPYLDGLTPVLETIAPVLRLSVYDASGGSILPKAEAATRLLGDRIGRRAEADAFLQRADQHFARCRDAVRAAGAPPVALISFLDARHARIYTAPGLFDDTLGRIGMRNAWPGGGQYWGFDTIGIERLTEIDAPNAHLIAFEPLPREALPTLRQSPIWNGLSFVRDGRFAVLPETLMFGMVNEAMRFAGQMADYVGRLR